MYLFLYGGVRNSIEICTYRDLILINVLGHEGMRNSWWIHLNIALLSSGVVMLYQYKNSPVYNCTHLWGGRGSPPSLSWPTVDMRWPQTPEKQNKRNMKSPHGPRNSRHTSVSYAYSSSMAWMSNMSKPHTQLSPLWHFVIVLPPARANTSCQSRVQNTWENKYRSPLIIGDIVKNFPVWIIHLIFCQHVVSQSENNPSDIPRSR